VRWLRRAAQAGTTAGRGELSAATDIAAGDDHAFVCSTCGRTDLPPAGDWDPPICLECDEEINFPAIEEVEITHDW
jgi:hypothetical protein